MRTSRFSSSTRPTNRLRLSCGCDDSVARASECDGVSSRALRFVERAVGGGEHRFDVIGMLGRRHADRERDADRFARRAAKRNALALDGGAEAIGNFARRVHRRAREQHDELVAGVATDDVAAAHAALEQRDDGLRHVVALQVAVRVVDELEVVDVDDEQRGRWVARAAAEQDVVRRVEEGAPYENAREIVELAGHLGSRGAVGAWSRRRWRIANPRAAAGRDDP